MADKKTESDAELVARALKGDREAMELLVARHYSVASSAAFNILGNMDLAQDCAQEAFLEAAETLAELRDPAKFSHYIWGIARRKAIYVIRRQKSQNEAIRGKAEESRSVIRLNTPSEQANHNEKLERIRLHVNQLPEIYREVLVLKYVDGKSLDDIAVVLDITLAAVDKRLMRGKDLLRESLKREME